MGGSGVGAYIAQVDRVLASAQGVFPTAGGPGSVQSQGPGVPAAPADSALSTGAGNAGDGYKRTWGTVTGLDAQTNGTSTAGAAEGQNGRAGATGVRQSAASAAAAIAPATGSPAGVKTLVTSMDDRLAAMQRQIESTKAQNQLLATRMRQMAMAYRQAAQASPASMFRGMGGGMGGGGMPSMGMGGGGGGLPGMGMFSKLPGMLTGQNSRRTNPLGDSVPGNFPSSYSGQGAENVRAAIRAALDRKGIRNPAARARWEAGMMLVAQRESNFRDVVNNSDSNALAGNPSGGPFQFIATTYRAYQEPGASPNHRDTFGQACAFINYAMRRYGVSIDGHDLASRIQQADPRRPPRGY
ncbi:lytic transglycosylase (plasmid) [Mycolicibacterium crocinum]|uniref:Lytic transglycosylase n=1 Tax=Mycolicibacterium crocinum TaxID=388459 RepID=A0ABY3U0L5_9MYCO|nr:lytic transglycosylase [Mycolicibacterium crocinum]ULN44718.1 lytic transglycosylase [Mycolicibacterium crocinum]